MAKVVFNKEKQRKFKSSGVIEKNIHDDNEFKKDSVVKTEPKISKNEPKVSLVDKTKSKVSLVDKTKPKSKGKPEKIIEKPKLKPEKVVEIIIEKEKVVEKPIYVDKFVEKIVEKNVYIDKVVPIYIETAIKKREQIKPPKKVLETPKIEDGVKISNCPYKEGDLIKSKDEIYLVRNYDNKYFLQITSFLTNKKLFPDDWGIFSKIN